MAKTALVTGANGGIGRALSFELVKRGYVVYATDIVFSDETTELFDANDKVKKYIMDVTSQDAVVEIREIVKADTDGQLDLLYCNAGRPVVAMATDVTDEEIQSLFELNLFAQMRLVREFVKMIIPTKGTIVFSGSVTRGIPLHANCLYTSSKAALDQYASTLQCELRNYGVKVIDVIGGYIKTPIFHAGENYQIPQDSIYNFEEYKVAFDKKAEVLLKNSASLGMPPEEFAKRTLDQVEKANLNTLRVYEGTNSGRMSLLQTFLPQKALINHILNLFGFNFDYRKGSKYVKE